MSRIAILGLGLLALALVLWATDSRLESHYPEGNEPEIGSAISRGWIPQWLPISATDVREVHSIDTNATWLAFDAPASELADLESLCDPILSLPDRYPRRAAHWWPADLSHTASPPEGKYTFLACSSGTLAIHLEDERAYFWRP